MQTMTTSCHVTAVSAVMEVASGEYGDQMVRLVKAVQRDDQTGPNGDANLHPLLWQRAEEVKNKHTTSCVRSGNQS